MTLTVDATRMHAQTRLSEPPQPYAVVWAGPPHLGAYEQVWPLLPHADQVRSLRYRHLEDHRAFVVAHGWLRLLTAACAGCGLRAVTDLDRHGKPFFRPGETIDLSLSHTRTFVAVGVARAARLGVDVEPSTTAPSATAARFLGAWTRAEAVGKARRTGLSGNLTLADFLAAQDPADAGPWQTFSLRLPKSHFLAVTLMGNGWAPAEAHCLSAVPPEGAAAYAFVQRVPPDGGGHDLHSR
jgi:phosphopantetheinyl transferase